MKTLVCKIFSFDAAHFLPDYKGKCRNLHGHTWKLEVEVSGPVGNETGMVVDFAKLKEVVNLRILQHLDHSLLNDKVSDPTCENLLDWIWKILFLWTTCEGMVKLERLRLWETPDSYAERKEGLREEDV